MVKKVVIGIDIRDLRIAQTGSKTYLEEVCREFKKGHTGFEFHFIDTWLPVYSGKNKFLKIVEHLRFFFWKQVFLPFICLAKGCDVLFCTDYFLPFFKFNFKTAVVFHDAFFWESPEHYNKLWLALLRTFGVPAANKADAIISTTHYAKKQVVKYAKIPPEKIFVVSLAPKSVSRKKNYNKFHNDFPLSGKKYILHVGVLEKRKNLPNLIKAFHLLLQDGFEEYLLVLVGNISTRATIDDSKNIQSLISSLSLENKVILPGFVQDWELQNYYRHAALYAFVSVNEGFGIPLLEAFQNNLPALASNNTSLPEVGGDAILGCNPFDVLDIKNKLKILLHDDVLKNEMVKKGQKKLSQYSWEKTANQLIAVFEKIHVNH